tara:strand:+ start:1050 stop:1877 length:828 start_codon:yes stop_codon:yes gene_type:complete
MGIDNSFLTKVVRNSFVFIPVLFLLLSCEAVDKQPIESHFNSQQRLILEERLAELTAREAALGARETEISNRESDLVTLLAELLKQKTALENDKANPKRIVSTKATSKTRSKRKTASTRVRQAASASKDKRTVLGSVENVFIDPPGMTFSARIDTGAETSSLNALDMVELERDGKPYVKFHVLDPKTGKKIELTQRIHGYIRIKDHEDESRRRPIVKMHVMLGNIDERINFTLADRRKFKHQVLLGRNLLRDLAIVDVSQKFTAPELEPVKRDAK